MLFISSFYNLCDRRIHVTYCKNRKMKRQLLSLTLLLICLNISAQTQLGNTLIGENLSDLSGRSVAISNIGNVAVVGAPQAVSAISGGIFQRGGHVRTYGFNGTVWTAGADFDAEEIGDRFGTSVAMSGDASIIACGAPGGDPNGINTGYVHVYLAQGDPQAPIGYIRYGNDIDGDDANSRFGLGTSIALNNDGTRIVIGGTNFVEVYENNNFSTPWVQIGQTILGESTTDNLGVSVSINAAGDRIIVGNPLSDLTMQNSGYARVYHFNGTSWVQLGQDIQGVFGDNAGASVDISNGGSRIAVGLPGVDTNGNNSGAVRIFDLINGNFWNQVGTDINGIGANTGLGGSGNSQEQGTLDLQGGGNSIVVGAKSDGNSNSSGYIQQYQFDTVNFNWVQIGTTIQGINANDEFGYSAALNDNDGTILIGGAHFADDNGNNSGHARVFDNSGNVLTINDVNSETNVIIFPNPTTGIINIKGMMSIKEIEIFDIEGRIVRKEINPSNTISLENTSKGLYFLRITDLNNITINKKIVVQ